MISGPPLWCVRHDGNLWRYSEGAWVEWDGEDGFGHELVQPIRAFQPRLNPVCPVCGEDEPKLEVMQGEHWVRGKRYENKVWCICRRCKSEWRIEPLSKPWEQEEE